LLIPANNIKQLKLTAVILLSPLFFFAQTLTGLWTGTLSNDSTTIRKDQAFEIALTEYRGKVYGYSRSEFIVNDTLFYILKRVKGTIEGDVCEVTDDDIISYNFRGKLDKGVKVTSTFRRNQTDSTWYLDGTWKTNVTKKYYAVTGKVGLQEEKDLGSSKIFPHLEELNLANDIAFYKEKKEVPLIVKVVHPEKIKTEYNDRPQPTLINNDVAIVPDKPTIQRAEPAPVPVVSTEVSNDIAIVEPEKLHGEKHPVADLPKTEIKKIPSSAVDVTPEPVSATIAVSKKPEVITTSEKPVASASTTPVADLPKTEINNFPVTTAVVIPGPESKAIVSRNKPEAVKTNDQDKSIKSEPVAKSTVKKEQPVVKAQPPPLKQPETIATKPEVKSVAVNNPVVEKKESTITPPAIAPVTVKPIEEITAKAAMIEGRKTEFKQVVNFKADSLELSLYDNGEIDGDTVSVFMDGVVMMSKQGLKSKAIKKTIYITKENEDFSLVLFADNLGKYPPNTGLLVVHDGDDVYNLHFSSDYQKSSGIVFRKKK
jgi:hypothetical protein